MSMYTRLTNPNEDQYMLSLCAVLAVVAAIAREFSERLRPGPKTREETDEETRASSGKTPC